MSKNTKRSVMDLPQVDSELTLYELTDLFYSFYRYHKYDCMIDYTQFNIKNGKELELLNKTIPRFDMLRRIEACRLGSRPYMGGKKIAAHIPNISLGHLKLLFDYLKLPFKSFFTDSDLVKLRIDRRLYAYNNFDQNELDEYEANEKTSSNIYTNSEISDDVRDAFVSILRQVDEIKKCHDVFPLRLVQDGFAACVHNDINYKPIPIKAIDLITEPFCEYDASKWSTYFVIKRLPVSEVLHHIKNKTDFWNINALRWALENAFEGRGLINNDHYAYTKDFEDNFPTCGENVSVKSFMKESDYSLSFANKYYGDLIVVEGHYLNTKGKVNKVIFFPSEDFFQVSESDKESRLRADYKDAKMANNFKMADLLFYREDVADSLKETITIIPFNRDELSLERQRGYGHELFSGVEVLMRLECSILNFAIIMGVPFLKNINPGKDGQNLLDLEINFSGAMVDLGDREFAQVPFTMDLNGMLAVRGALIEHIKSKAFLGGLDGMEVKGEGRGANIANLRLVRDARIHKHDVEAFSQGMTEFYTKIFRKVLDSIDSDLNGDDVLIQKKFVGTLQRVLGYDLRLLEYDKKDLVEDTGLPYWIELEAIRNGGSHFGAAEMVVYSEIKQVFGDGLSQSALQALNRIGIKSLLGSQDAIDILGDPKQQISTEQDQIYRALMETVAIIGSVSTSSVNFENIPILPDKDDHVAHLSQAHNVKANQILEKLKSAEVTPAGFAEWSKDQLDTRHELILKLAALSNHISMHAEQLNRFGSSRTDINRLKEETNTILQSSEAMLNSMQQSLRALKAKQQEEMMKLQNLSPENVAEQQKNQIEMSKLQVQMYKIDKQVEMANSLKDQNREIKIADLIDKASARNTEAALKAREQNIKLIEIESRKGDKNAKQ